MIVMVPMFQNLLGMSLWSINVIVDNDCGANIWNIITVMLLWFINVLLWHQQCLIGFPRVYRCMAMFNWAAKDEVGAKADVWKFLMVVSLKRSTIYAGNQWTIWLIWCTADHAFSKVPILMHCWSLKAGNQWTIWLIWCTANHAFSKVLILMHCRSLKAGNQWTIWLIWCTANHSKVLILMHCQSLKGADM